MEDQGNANRESYRAEIAALIERAVLPEMSARHRLETEVALPACSESAVDAATQLALDSDLPALEKYLRASVPAGYGLEPILLDLIPRAARRLNEGWAADTLSFVEVTLASGVLARAVRVLAPDFHAGTKQSSVGAKRAVFGAFPGDGHALGSAIAAEFFRRDGWDVELVNGVGRRHLINSVQERRPMLLGISVATTASIHALPSFVREVRERLGGNAPAIFVGGEAVLHARPQLMASGCDVVVSDVQRALLQARSIVSARPVEPARIQVSV